jgi:hypothetical protein
MNYRYDNLLLSVEGLRSEYKSMGNYLAILDKLVDTGNMYLAEYALNKYKNGRPFCRYDEIDENATAIELSEYIDTVLNSNSIAADFYINARHVYSGICDQQIGVYPDRAITEKLDIEITNCEAISEIMGEL